MEVVLYQIFIPVLVMFIPLMVWALIVRLYETVVSMIGNADG